MSSLELDPGTREELRVRTMRGTRPMGTAGLALLIAVPLILGLIGGGVWGYLIAGSSSATPAGKDVSFTLVAYMTSSFTGFLGKDGAIEGLKNPMLTVGQYDRVTITLMGSDATPHNVYVEGYGVQSANVAAANASTAVTFNANTQGTFAYYCSIPGHRAMGMEGKLVVGSGTGSGTDTLPPIGPEVLPVNDIVRNVTDVPPPITRTSPATVHVFLNATEVNGEIEPGVSYLYWTYNGKVPGPFFRVRVNDTVVVHFHNEAASIMNHSVDFHAATGPGGGMAASESAPGETHVFSFKALVPGLFVYHCGTPSPAAHIANGMYGLILVQPETPLPAVDHEFYVMQGELYTKWPIHTKGNQLFDDQKLLAETPTYVVFNGAYQALTSSTKSLKALVNETVRIYFGVGGPNVISSFHIIGEIFDRVWLYGGLLDPPMHGLQTVLVPPGGSTVVDLKLEYAAPGGTNYVLVDHALVNAVGLGAVGFLHVTGPTDSTVFNG